MKSLHTRDLECSAGMPLNRLHHSPLRELLLLHGPHIFFLLLLEIVHHHRSRLKLEGAHLGGAVGKASHLVGTDSLLQARTELRVSCNEARRGTGGSFAAGR